MGTAAVPVLAALGSVSASVELTAPSVLGPYYYGACVDAVAGESDTTNNCSEAVIVMVLEDPDPTPAQPDLVVSSVSLTTSFDGSPGAFLRFEGQVRNEGDAESAATTLRFYRSTNSRITTNDRLVSTAAIEALAPSGSAGAGSLTLIAPSSAGTYYYGACVAAVPGESDTTNNCSSSPVRLDVD